MAESKQAETVNIKLKSQMSGTYNGRDWPAKGSVVAVPPGVADKLIAQGHAERESGKSEAVVNYVTGSVVETAAVDYRDDDPSADTYDAVSVDDPPADRGGRVRRGGPTGKADPDNAEKKLSR